MQLFTDDMALTQVNDNMFFGAFSVYGGPHTTFSGLSSIQKNLVNHSEINIYRDTLYVTTKELNNPANIRIPTSFFKKADDTVIETQRNFLRKVLREETLSDQCFDVKKPINSVMVSRFGSYRKLPTGFQYFHQGVDLRARTGTPIYSMSRGKVRVADNFVVAGNAVIIEHGFGIFSKYYHLDEILVSVDQEVEMGQLLGKAGGTGRVEAPHLHWEVSWKGLSIDPLEFIDLWSSVCP